MWSLNRILEVQKLVWLNGYWVLVATRFEWIRKTFLLISVGSAMLKVILKRGFPLAPFKSALFLPTIYMLLAHIRIPLTRGTKSLAWFKWIVFWLALIPCFKEATAKDLGKVGTVFEMQEIDLLAWIEQKLLEAQKSGEWETVEMQLRERAKHYVERPTPVELPKTTKPRRFPYDPSVRAPYDLQDHKGTVFHRRGDVVNPLETVTLQQPMFFINGDDAAQVQFALAFEEEKNIEAIWILVKGSVPMLEKQLKRTLYFDQGGAFVKKLGIQQVPAIVVQEGARLMIDEMLVPESFSNVNEDVDEKHEF